MSEKKLQRTERKSLDYIKKDYIRTRTMPGAWYLSSYKFKFDITHMQPFLKKLKDKKYNPKDLKQELALSIVALYWGEKKAEKAKQEFEKVFKDKELPSDIKEFFAPRKEYPILELLFHLGLAKSKGEAKRLIQQGGARVDSKKITDINKIIKIEEGLVIQAGKRNFARLTLKDGREE